MLKDIKALFLFIILLGPAGLQAQISVGAEQLTQYLPQLSGRKVALVVNPTSMVAQRHLVDTLRALKVNIRLIFAPEHGFRGNYSAGAHVKNDTDAVTRIPVVSLYGNNKKPKPQQMKAIDVVIFDIQDVGARFYTYISTLHYVMEACAENKKTLIVLDRPNPNGFYVDGPVLNMKYKSFVGMHPVPIVHGMTVGEYARMINGERWLKDSLRCNLQVIHCKGYSHDKLYVLPVKPSPNLPTMESVYLYPSLCLFEGTNISVGRGTDKPFECIGKPGFVGGNYQFYPKSIKGVADDPPYKNDTCSGFLLSGFSEKFLLSYQKVYLLWLSGAYQRDTSKATFFNDFFDKLAGNDQLRKLIVAGANEDFIRKNWQADLEAFMRVRQKYLLYQDFKPAH